MVDQEEPSSVRNRDCIDIATLLEGLVQDDQRVLLVGQCLDQVTKERISIDADLLEVWTGTSEDGTIRVFGDGGYQEC
jgi:hypothetical protein